MGFISELNAQTLGFILYYEKKESDLLSEERAVESASFSIYDTW